MQNQFTNAIDIDLPNGDYVEAGSLWQKLEDKMILVDDDRYVEQPYDEEIYKPLNDSKNTKDNL